MPSEREGFRRSDWWLTVFRWSLIGTTLLFLVAAGLNTYTAIDHNPQGEHCRYVEEGEWHHIRYEGYPCRLTMENVYLFLMTYLILAIPAQGPLLIARTLLRR
jgi:hypothetical protein